MFAAIKKLGSSSSANSSPTTSTREPGGRIVIGAGQPIPFDPEGGKNDVTNKSSLSPRGVSVLNAGIQRRFAAGIHYNMKVVIRGDRNSGKTALWRRLQGKGFGGEGGGSDETYTPTQEIQVASIAWSYRPQPECVVKVDVWDVIDEGVRRGGRPIIPQKPPQSQQQKFGRKKATAKETAADGGGNGGGGPLKLTNDFAGNGKMGVVPSPPGEVGEEATALETLACDAATIDVYKQCNAVIMIFDVTRPWTWAYVERELGRVPARLPVLVLANKVDLLTSAGGNNNNGGESRPPPTATPSEGNCSPVKTASPQPQQFVSVDDCLAFLATFERPVSLDQGDAPPATIRFARASMKQALGLRFVYNFFNVPFLLMQRAALEQALSTNAEELAGAEAELDAAERRDLGEERANELNLMRRRQQYSLPKRGGRGLLGIGAPSPGEDHEFSAASLSASSSRQRLLSPANNRTLLPGKSIKMYGKNTAAEKEGTKTDENETVETIPSPGSSNQRGLYGSTTTMTIKNSPVAGEEFSTRVRLSALEIGEADGDEKEQEDESSSDEEDGEPEENNEKRSKRGGFRRRPLVDMYEEDYDGEEEKEKQLEMGGLHFCRQKKKLEQDSSTEVVVETLYASKNPPSLDLPLDDVLPPKATKTTTIFPRLEVDDNTEVETASFVGAEAAGVSKQKIPKPLENPSSPPSLPFDRAENFELSSGQQQNPLVVEVFASGGIAEQNCSLPTLGVQEMDEKDDEIDDDADDEEEENAGKNPLVARFESIEDDDNDDNAVESGGTKSDEAEEDEKRGGFEQQSGTTHKIQTIFPDNNAIEEAPPLRKEEKTEEKHTAKSVARKTTTSKKPSNSTTSSVKKTKGKKSTTALSGKTSAVSSLLVEASPSSFDEFSTTKAMFSSSPVLDDNNGWKTKREEKAPNSRALLRRVADDEYEPL